MVECSVRHSVDGCHEAVFFPPVVIADILEMTHVFLPRQITPEMFLASNDLESDFSERHVELLDLEIFEEYLQKSFHSHSHKTQLESIVFILRTNIKS